MATVVDVTNVPTAGPESSPEAEAPAGLRADEARYVHTEYRHDVAASPATEAAGTDRPG